MAMYSTLAGVLSQTSGIIAVALSLLSAMEIVAAAPPRPNNPTPGSTTSPGPVTESVTVTLRWDAVSNATRYEVGVVDVGTGHLVVDTSVIANSHTVTLVAGKTYRWNVAARNSAGLSGYTALRFFQTPSPVVKPATPNNPTPGSTTSPGPITDSVTVTLRWDAVTGAASYEIGVVDVATGQLVVDTTSAGNSHTVTLTAGKTYRWNVAARNSAGLSGYTALRFIQTPGSGETFPVRIIQDFIPTGRNNRPAYPMIPEYITIHGTDNWSIGANAEMHSRWLNNPDTGIGMPNNAQKPISFQFSVDDAVIYQHLPLTESAWHAGDGENGIGNRQSIGIEICMNSDGDIIKAEENAVRLTAKLLVEFGLPIDRVKQHNHWSGKDCPSFIRARANGWEEFLAKVQTFMNGGPTVVNVPQIAPNGGVFSSATPVTMSSTTPGVAIRYTTDGSEPTAGSPLYQGPITVNGHATLRAKAFLNDVAESQTTVAAFQVSGTAAMAPVLKSGAQQGSFSVTFDTEIGFQYTLEFRDSAANSEWATGTTITGTGQSATLTDPNATPPARIYRVRVE